MIVDLKVFFKKSNDGLFNFLVLYGSSGDWNYKSSFSLMALPGVRTQCTETDLIWVVNENSRGPLSYIFEPLLLYGEHPSNHRVIKRRKEEKERASSPRDTHSGRAQRRVRQESRLLLV